MMNSRWLSALLVVALAPQLFAWSYTVQSEQTVSYGGKTTTITNRWYFEDTVYEGNHGVKLLGVEPQLASAEPEIPSMVIDNSDEPLTILEIGDGAFAGFTLIEKLTIPNTVKRIGDYAFSNCLALAEVDFGDGLRSIGKRPFVNTAVREITLPDSLLSMDGNIAAGTVYSAAITVSDSSHFVQTEDGCLYNFDKTRMYACPVRAEGTITLADETIEIIDDAFFGCFRLTNIVIGADVTTIGSKAFNVSGIWPGLSAPEASAKLTSVTYLGLPPANVAEDIYYGAPAALVNCVAKANRSQWPNEWKGHSVTCIDERQAPIGNVEYTDADGNVWNYEVVDNCAIVGRKVQVVPATAVGSVSVPEEIDGWPVVEIGEKAFLNCQDIVTIAIPANVTNIVAGAFNGCKALTEFTVNSTNEYYTTRAGLLYSKNLSTLVKVPALFEFKSAFAITDKSETQTVLDIPPYYIGMTLHQAERVVESSQTTGKTVSSVEFTPMTDFSSYLEHVTHIADYAFSDCGTLPEGSVVYGTIVTKTNNVVQSTEVGSVVMTVGTDTEEQTISTTNSTDLVTHEVDGSVVCFAQRLQLKTTVRTVESSVPRPVIPSGIVYSELIWKGSVWEGKETPAVDPKEEDETPDEPEPEPEPEPETPKTIQDGDVLAVNAAVATTIETGLDSTFVKRVYVSGLPSGLRLVKTTDRTTKISTWTIQGVATKSAIKTPTLTVYYIDGSKAKIKVNAIVSAFPAWAPGYYNGVIYGSDSMPLGSATATISSYGRLTLSLKMPSADGKKSKSYSLTMKSFSAYDPEIMTYSGKVSGKLESGKCELDVECSPADTGTGVLLVDLGNGMVAELEQNIWKRKDLTPPTYQKGAKLTYDDLTLKLGSYGKVSWSGKVSGDNGKTLRVSGTSQLFNDGETVLIYITPRTNLVGGVAEIVNLN